MSAASGTIRLRHVAVDGRTSPWRWFATRLYDTQAELAAAAYRYAPWMGREFHRNSAATVQPAPRREHITAGGRVTDLSVGRGPAGVIRFHRGRLGSSVIAHEAVHAALVVYRLDLARTADLGDDCGPDEENLAYLVGEATRALVDWLYSVGAYDVAEEVAS